MRCASLHNVVERVFGMLKKHWGILTRPPCFSMNIQARIPAGIAAVHNFILDHDPFYFDDSEDDLEAENDPNPGQHYFHDDYGALATGLVTRAEKTRGERM